MADPVALYIYSVKFNDFQLDTSGTEGTPDPGDLVDLPVEAFNWQRGHIDDDKHKHQGLRCQVKIPKGMVGKDGKPLTVSNIWDPITMTHIMYGAQFADYVTMNVSAVVIPNQQPAEPVDCYNPDAKATTDQRLPSTMNMAAMSAYLVESSVDEATKPFPFFPKTVGRKYN